MGCAINDSADAINKRTIALADHVMLKSDGFGDDFWTIGRVRRKGEKDYEEEQG